MMSELTKGKYSNDFEDVHPDILTRYLGIHGPPSQRHCSGAGSSDEDEYHNIRERIIADQEHHIRHDPIEVPQNGNPFASAEAESLFINAHRDLVAAGTIPFGYGVTEGEWDEAVYPEFEDIKSGRRKKSHSICLPFELWWPRAVTWAQGLDLMVRICMAERGE